MDKVKILKNRVKKYIDNADESVLKMGYAMLEVNEKSDWWDDIPMDAKKSINKALKDLDEGKGISNKHVKKMHPEWCQNSLVTPGY